MKRRTAIALGALALLVTGPLLAHDMFLKLASFFLEPNANASVELINGTFEASENVITRDRMLDVSIVGSDGRVTHPPTSAWRDSAVHHPNPDSADTAILEFETGGPGTYVIGVSTAPTVFTLTGEQFDDYLLHDGVLDVLEERKERGELGTPATERYSKHVKAIVQVGDRRTDTYGHRLGYPVELVPLSNPYELDVGEELAVQFLKDGRPVADQIVYASPEGHPAHDEAGVHREEVTTRTDEEGVARIEVTRAGRWYVRLIHMVAPEEDPEVDYESNWATLTFEVR